MYSVCVHVRLCEYCVCVLCSVRLRVVTLHDTQTKYTKAKPPRFLHGQTAFFHVLGGEKWGLVQLQLFTLFFTG